jgi:hypothetical protein
VSERRAASRAGQLAIDALEWQSCGDPYPPDSIRGLSTADQAALAREAHRVVSACEAAAARVARAAD